MEAVQWVRIDTRLVHGQICTRWCKALGVNRIVVVNDALAKDDFMAGVYKMAAPTGVKVDIYSVEQSVAEWKKGKIGGEKTLLIVKDPFSCYQLYKNDIPIKKINVGNLVAGTGKISIVKEVFITEDEFTMLKEMLQSGIDVFIQNVPDSDRLDFEVIEKKFR